MKKIVFNLVSIFTLMSSQLFASESVNKMMQLKTSYHVLLFISFTAISFGILSSGYALSISLSAYAAAEKKNRTAAFIPAIMPGSQGLYSFAISFLMLQSMIDTPVRVALAGVICGLPCFFSAIGQATTAASCIKSINNGQMDSGQALIATAVPELYALTGLAGAFLAMTI